MHSEVFKRIYDRVEIDYETKCWNWPGTLNKGYGQVSYKGRNCRTHRITYEHAKGPIPEGYEVDHRCENKACCNPDHLDAVTRTENLRRYRKNHPLLVEPADHGTNAGYVAHYRRGQVPCAPCKQARADYERQRREAKAAALIPVRVIPRRSRLLQS